MNKYDEMSDFEINKLVASSIKIKFYDRCGYIEIDDALEGIRTGSDEFKEFDPCNSWDDMGPIIVENDITISPSLGAWLHDGKSHGYNNDSYDIGKIYESSDKKLLRAAAIVFLMIKESTKCIK